MPVKPLNAGADLAYAADLLTRAKDSYYNSGDFLRLTRADQQFIKRVAGLQVQELDDRAFDTVEDWLRERQPNNPYFKKIGAVTKSKVKLPYPMGSLDKIKPDTGEVGAFIDPDLDYCISDKLDGVSIELVYSKAGVQAFTRGNGLVGQDISYLVPHFKIPDQSPFKAVRGEIIMSKAKFSQLWAQEFANARNMVSGLVNRKDVHKAVKDVDVIVYGVLDPIGKVSTQLAQAKAAGFHVVPHKVLSGSDLDDATLSQLLAKRKAGSKYEIDGLVLVVDARNKPVVGNPPWGRAFKDMSQQDGTVATVVNISWTASKDGFLKPRIEVEPVRLAGVTVTYCTAHNAKYVWDNKLGPGAVINLVRSGDVVPYVTSIVRPARKPQMPDVDWEWNATGVDAILVDHEHDAGVQVKRITQFFVTLGTEFISEGILTRVFDAGYTSTDDIMKMSVKDWLTVPGVKDVLARKCFTSVRQSLTDVWLPTLADATGFFGRGFGTKRFALIYDEHPDILEWSRMTEQELTDIALSIHGFSTTTAKQFAQGYPKFRRWLKGKPITFAEPEAVETKGSAFTGQAVTFTGFRSPEWAALITEQGGTVIDFGAKTTLLVYGGKMSTKVEKARAKGISVLSQQEFAALLVKKGLAR